MCDTGVGIAPELLGHVFEPFSQAPQALDRPRGGLGLGLAMVKGLVELHGGTVAVRSEGLGQGAQFAVRLPLATAPARAAEPPVRKPSRPYRVLVIEDNADAADTLRDALEIEGHAVQVAYNGPDGIALAREFHPQVVVCDIGLPGMDGYDVARAFRADDALKTACLVALSGYAQPEDLRHAAEAGFDRHVAKPPTLESLEQVFADVAPSNGVGAGTK